MGMIPQQEKVAYSERTDMNLEELQHLMSKHRREAAKNREHQPERQKPNKMVVYIGSHGKKRNVNTVGCS